MRLAPIAALMVVGMTVSAAAQFLAPGMPMPGQQPQQQQLPPCYADFQPLKAEAEKRGRFRQIAGPDGKDGSVTIHQDAKLYVSLLSPGQEAKYELGEGRYAWLQVARGAVELNGKSLNQGDGAAVSEEQKLVVEGTSEAEVLLFDLA